MKERKQIKLAVVVSNFPSMSQTFIALQLAELAKQPDIDLTIFNLGSVGEFDWIPFGARDALERVTIINLADIKNDPGFKKKKPLLMLKVYASYYQIQRTLKHLPEVELRRHMRRIVDFAYFCQIMDEFDLIHLQFSNHASKFISMKKAGFISQHPKLACSVRGFDISKESAIEGMNWEELFEHFELFLPVCSFFEDILRSNGCDKNIRVTGSPINVEHINNLQTSASDDKESVKFISVGRLVEKKGIDVAIKACAKLIKDGVSFQYDIIGSGPLKQELEDLTAQLGIIEHVRFHGGLPSQKTMEKMSQANVLLTPSKTASDGDSEGIPNVLKEGMLLGIQVATTQHSGIPELVNNDIPLAREDDVNEFYDLLVSILNSREQWDMRATENKRIINSLYSPEATTETLINAYRETLAQ